MCLAGRPIEARLNEAAERRTLARDNIRQGNCDVTDQRLGNNLAG